MSLWGDTRLQVIRFSAGDDFPEQDTAYQIFRHVTYNTGSWPNGAYYQISELEFFGSLEAVTPGDFNDDGLVDLADFTILAENFNESFAFDVAYSKGDMTRNGTVDLADFASFREVYATRDGAVAAAVPEPGSLVLLTFGFMMALPMAFRRRKEVLDQTCQFWPFMAPVASRLDSVVLRQKPTEIRKA